MKKLFILFISFVLAFGIVIGISACEGLTPSGKNTKTSSEYEKVKVALNGVEKSFTSGKTSASKKTNGAVAYAEDKAEAALFAIFAQYTEGDNQGSNFDELDYDQPPMRQFQYLKAVFEEMGGDYKLGEKYYYDITGSIYFNAESGEKIDKNQADAANYLYNYVFGFAMSVELKENDLIFAEVAFKISLNKGAEKYETSWYVSFDLEYDFDEETPTYTLLMYTDNKEGDLAFLNREQGYEYDYVNMQKGSIKEWRKFVLDAEKEIVLTGNYASFDDYIAEGTEFNADTCKWLKNGTFYKLTQRIEERNTILARNYVEGLGMNSTDIKSAAFFAKEGEQNKVIDTYYKKISALYGDDIIYDLVCKKEHSSGKDDAQKGWNDSVSASVPSDMPAFTSRSATFNVQEGEDGTTIFISGATADDYAEYVNSLEQKGYSPLGNGAYSLNLGETTVIVAINADEGAIFVATVSNSRESIEIEYGYDYDSNNYAGYTKNEITAKKDIAGIIEKISSGTVKENELDALILNESCVYSIRLLVENQAVSLSEYAEKVAMEYKNKYSGWTQRYESSVNYKSIVGKDVLVIVATDTTGNDAYVNVYVLLFEAGTVENIVENDIDDNGENGGENGNENGGENGDDNDIIEVKSLSLIGSFNDWNLNDGLIYFYQSEENTFVLNNQFLSKNTTFKIIANGSWEINGGFGYANVNGIEKYNNLFSENGKESNILVEKDCIFTITAQIGKGVVRLSLTEAIDPSQGQGDGGGENGQGQGGKTDEEGQGGGQGSGQGQGSDEPKEEVQIYVAVLDAYRNVASDGTYTFYEGESIDVTQFKTKDSQKVYTNYSCTELDAINGDTVTVYSGMTLYVWELLPKGTFTIYDVNGNETTVSTSFEDFIGDGVYFGYSFGSVLYWDEACTQQIDLYYNFELTEEGITVYKKTYEDFFTLNIKCYINGHLWADSGFTNSNGIYRKGKVYYLYGYNSILDFGTYRSWIGQDAEFYIGDGKDENNSITDGCYIATTENVLDISVYTENDFTVYTIKTDGGKVLTEDYVTIYGFDEFYYSEGMGNTFEYDKYYCDYCTVSGNTITMHGVHSYPYSLKVYNVWDGRALNENSGYVNTYFNSDSPFTFNGDVGASTEFFKDAACSDPIILEDNGNGYGEYVLKASTVLYTPINPTYIP